MTDIISILSAPFMAPVWAGVGVGATKLVDGLLARRKAPEDALTAATNAHRSLNNSLQSSFDLMARELIRLRAEHLADAERYHAQLAAIEAERHADNERYQAKLAEMERELMRLRRILIDSNIPFDMVDAEDAA